MTGSETRVPVALGARSYDIVIGRDIIARAGALMRPVTASHQAIVVTDQTVAELHLARLEAGLREAGYRSANVVLPPGEQTKCFAVLEHLIDRLIALGVERRTTVVALGGGVIGDIAGFAAAVVLRGVPFVQVPTTLLAQVDSSVGGKTAINVEAGKNLVGAFYQPALVVADTAALDTLPRRERLAGYAEVVKYGAIGDRDFFDWLEANGAALIDGDAAAAAHAVARSCAMKADIVARDEREGGVRALLNLGHTFGHALESRAGYGAALLHGEAVAIGMTMAAGLSVRLGRCPGQDATRLARHMAQIGLPTRPGDVPGVTWDATDLLHRMGRDKKVVDGRLNLILLRGIGEAYIAHDTPQQALMETLEEAIAA